jgi:hypothetical protein
VLWVDGLVISSCGGYFYAKMTVLRFTLNNFTAWFSLYKDVLTLFHPDKSSYNEIKFYFAHVPSRAPHVPLFSRLPVSEPDHWLRPAGHWALSHRPARFRKTGAKTNQSNPADNYCRTPICDGKLITASAQALRGVSITTDHTHTHTHTTHFVGGQSL